MSINEHGSEDNEEQSGIAEFAEMLSSDSHACEMRDDSRIVSYRFKELYDKGGELAQQEISRRKRGEQWHRGAHRESSVRADPGEAIYGR